MQFHAVRPAWLASFLILTAIALATPVVQASPSGPGEQVVAWVYYRNLAELNALAARLDVWEVDHRAGALLALLSPEEQAGLQQAGYRMVVDQEKTAQLRQGIPPIPGQVSGIPGFPCYRTVEETYAALAQLAVDNPGLATWVDVGDSWEKNMPGGNAGHDLNTLVLTNFAKPGPKPVFFLMAAIHAREYATAELATRFAEGLVADYGVNPDVTWLLDYTEVHILPQANPDGRKKAETGLYWRKNTDNDDGCSSSSSWGVDLNRNSSFKWGLDNSGSSPFACSETYRGPSADSEPETQFIQSYVAALFPDQRGSNDSDAAPADTSGLFITLHSYGRWVLFPWGWGPGPAPNNTQLESLGRKFGYFTNYEVCQSGEPFCIYTTNGTTDDWAYGELGMAAYTFEIGTDFFQPCSTFTNSVLKENLPALLYAAKAARRPYQTPAGPESLDLSLSADSVPAGTQVILTASADDTRYDSSGWGNEPVQAIAAVRFSVEAPSWVEGIVTLPLDPVDGNFNDSLELVQASIDTTGWPMGRHTLFVESKDAMGNWGVPSAIFLDIQDVTYRPGLSPLVSEGKVGAGEVISYTLQVSNQGSVADIFDLAVSNHNWPTSVEPVSSGPLVPGASTDLTVTVTVPADAEPLTSDSALVTATSQGDPTQIASASVTTKVKAPFVFSLEPESAALPGAPEEVVTYTLEVTNLGVESDEYTYNLGEHTWETIVQFPAGPLAPDETALVTVTVAIPPSAEHNASDSLSLTFASVGDPSQTRTATLTTTSVWHILFIPFARR
ncbi:MAG TPA: M14 family zinc carboxypeptidase [Anaerolineales bacterium]|nr:M14 family zinc carboxypeptidase [Anaerolineales bacterium]